ncbi:MAG: helicase-related protein [Halobacteria archaeon]
MELTLEQPTEFEQQGFVLKQPNPITDDPNYRHLKTKALAHYRTLAQEQGASFQWRPYQPEFATIYGLRRNNICALTLGLGKTLIAALLVALLYDRQLGNLRPGAVQIVAPSKLSATSRWIPDLEKVKALRGYIKFLKNERDILESREPVWVYPQDFPKRKSKTVNGSLAKRIRRSGLSPNQLIIDEAHHLKRGSQRSEHLLYIRQRAKRCLLLSGTISDGRLELLDYLCWFAYQQHWPYNPKTFKQVFGSKRKVNSSYLYGSQEADQSKEVNHLAPNRLAEFSHLIERFVHRASYRDPNIYPYVTLPEENVQVELLIPTEEHRRYYRETIRQNQQNLKKVAKQGNPKAPALQLLNPVLSASNTPPVPNRKLDRLRELVAEYASENRKTAVFAHAVASARYITQALSEQFGIIRLYAQDPEVDPPETSEAQRNRAVTEFMFNPEVPVGVFSYNLASESIDLTSAEQIIFYDYPWESVKVQQALFRVVRPGSVADRVRVVYLGNRGFIDEHQHRLLAEKLNSTNLLLDFDRDAIQANRKDAIDVTEVVQQLIL